MTITAGIVLVLVEMATIAFLARTKAAARWCSLLAFLLLPLPVWVNTLPFNRSVLATFMFWVWVRSTDLALDGPPESFLERLAHVSAIVDTRLARACPSRFDHRAAGRAAISLAIMAGAFWVIWLTREILVVRWLAGSVLVVAGFEALTAVIGLLALALGFDAPALSDAPYRSVSVNEFWSRRWNRVVSEVLRQRVFKPFVKRSPGLALGLAFAASAGLHLYLIGVNLNLLHTLCWASFFLVQPLVILAERKLEVEKWPPLAGWLWTVTILLLLAPLFIEPSIRLFNL
ncbi:MAG: membrane bound O-acyl transferase family-domain-containing protein [Blastocatellia bacterium]|nr:membrane bound O-acyl transferase family-domain-containing protein [Blastocatellia bacterium]